MNRSEFLAGFDVQFSNITSNMAPGLNPHEMSLFLTKSQDEITKNYFSSSSKGNTLGQGFDDSAKRQADFSALMKTSKCLPYEEQNGTFVLKKYICRVPHTHTSTEYKVLGTNELSIEFIGAPYNLVEGSYSVEFQQGFYYIRLTPDSEYPEGKLLSVNGVPTGCDQIVVAYEASASLGKIDSRSFLYAFPEDVFIPINEVIITNNGIRQVITLKYDDYIRYMSKPYKRPVKNQAWRLFSGGESAANNYTRYVELITGPSETVQEYNIRYVRRPNPIILDDLDGLTINGCYLEGTTSVPGAKAVSGECELDPILHEDILQRAVELAKIAWTSTGQDNAQMVIQSGQRSE